MKVKCLLFSMLVILSLIALPSCGSEDNNNITSSSIDTDIEDAEDTEEELPEFEYRVFSGDRGRISAVFTKRDEMSDDTLTIPSEYDESTVMEVCTDGFTNVSNFKYLYIPKTVEIIGDRAFGCCSDLETAELREGVQEIGKEAFYFCPKLSKIRIPSSVKKIGADAFKNSPNVVILAKKGSYAEKYANKNNIAVSNE